jgi:DNA-directed RNA polymerase specialized sigma subunit, sigma24 homolog
MLTKNQITDVKIEGDGVSLDEAIELWARWTVTGGSLNSGGFQSMLHMMMVTHCVFSGGGKKAITPDEGVEAEIESCLMKLRREESLIPDVIKIEYMLDATQMKKAERMGISLKTYKKRLQQGRKLILMHLAERRGGHWQSTLKLSYPQKN